MIQKITDHIVKAKDRLLQQYKGKPRIEAMVEALVKPLQELEDTFYDLLLKRTIDEAEGIQLDLLGDTVGIKRRGLPDDRYRLRIRARILVNISNGEPEGLIQIYKLLTQAGVVVYQEYYNAAHAFYSDGSITDIEDVNLVLELMEAASCAGVRVDFMGKFPSDLPFTFEGSAFPAGGFGTLDDASVGGKLGALYVMGPEFAMDGADPKTGGFSSIHDPVVGGRLVSL